MTRKPLVSVITIFLDAQRFIREAVESVLAQSYEGWELLLVDDGSMDSSSTIARQYAAEHPGRVRYLEHEGHRNRGMSASRNVGIAAAKGEYLAFLDADDVWLPHKLERQVAILESRPDAGMVYGATRCWHSWTGDPEDLRHDYVPALGVEPDTLIGPPMLLTLTLEGQAVSPCPSDVLVRRETVDRVSGFEEAFHDLCEDRAFFSKVCLHANVFVSGECWDLYRQHPDSCYATAKRTGQRDSAWRVYLDWLARYVSEQRIRDADLRRALRKRQRPYRLWHRALNHARRRARQALVLARRAPK